MGGETEGVGRETRLVERWEGVGGEAEGLG